MATVTVQCDTCSPDERAELRRAIEEAFGKDDVVVEVRLSRAAARGHRRVRRGAPRDERPEQSPGPGPRRRTTSPTGQESPEGLGPPGPLTDRSHARPAASLPVDVGLLVARRGRGPGRPARQRLPPPVRRAGAGPAPHPAARLPAALAGPAGRGLRARGDAGPRHRATSPRARPSRAA